MRRIFLVGVLGWFGACSFTGAATSAAGDGDGDGDADGDADGDDSADAAPSPDANDTDAPFPTADLVVERPPALRR
ncbi:MAG: hypothetical protein V3V08_16530 [Nannocystaceae bacterium]